MNTEFALALIEDWQDFDIFGSNPIIKVNGYWWQCDWRGDANLDGFGLGKWSLCLESGDIPVYSLMQRETLDRELAWHEFMAMDGAA